MAEQHECVFVEEQEPSGRLILPPCIVCGMTAMDSLNELRHHAAGDEWAPFADLLEGGDLPAFGYRCIVRIGDDGEMHLDYAWSGDKVQGYLMLGAVMGSALEMFHEHLHTANDS
jgi:hypothetical protein